MMSSAIIKVRMPNIENWNANRRINPKNARKAAKVMGINSGKIKISIPATTGMPEKAGGILNEINRSPRAMRYPPAMR